MFTGIIEKLGKVVERRGPPLVIEARSPWKGLLAGESISVNGVCLTLEKSAGPRMTFRLLPETLRVSSLGALQPGDSVNLERSLRLGDRLGGHLLLGHVDGQGTVLSRSRSGEAVTLAIKVPRALRLFLVPKGPVALDGVSLTLGSEINMQKVPGTFCLIQVHLVSHTLRATTLGQKKAGSRVNIEVDPVAKYLRGVL